MAEGCVYRDTKRACRGERVVFFPRLCCKAKLPNEGGEVGSLNDETYLKAVVQYRTDLSIRIWPNHHAPFA